MRMHGTFTTAIALGVTAAGLVATPARAATEHRLVPQRLVCESLNDGWGDNTDEISLRYGGIDFRTNMKVGEQTTPPPATFGYDILIELWELDTGTWRNPHDKIGAHNVKPGSGDQTLEFHGDGATYRLVYRVEAVD